MIKVFATLFIVFHHYQQVYEIMTGGGFRSVILFWGGSFYWGYMVEFFFLISGFCMLGYIKKISAGMSFYEFYSRRASRLLPLMAISGVVCMVLQRLYLFIFGTTYCGMNPTLFGVFLQAVGVQDGWGFNNPSLNNPTWYCSVLLLCYIVFYMIVYWSGRAKVSPVYGMLLFIFIGCGIQKYGIERPFFNASTCRGFYAFFAGVLLAVLMPRIKACRWSPLVAITVIVVFAVEYATANGGLSYMPYLLTFVLYPAIIVALQSFPLKYISCLSFWEGWAKTTYSAFIWHTSLFLTMYIILGVCGIDVTFMGSQTMMLFCAVILQVIACVSYGFIECPLNKKLQSFLLVLKETKAERKV